MFALRKVTEDGVETNIALGDGYTIVNRETSPSDFERAMGAAGFDAADGIYAIVLTYRGVSIPLYDTHGNYIVTENGATYCNLSYK